MFTFSFINFNLSTAFKFNNLHHLNRIQIIGILLFAKVGILNLFSSQILSITIQNPFMTINTIEQLESRHDLMPLLFVHESSLNRLLVNIKFHI